MKRFFQRILSVMMSLTLCLSFSMVAFAADCTKSMTCVETDANATALGDEGIMPLGSVSGYAQGTITKENNTLVVWCNSSGLFESGMGITVKSTNANFSSAVGVKGYSKKGTAKSFSGLKLPMNDEIQVDNLTHRKLEAYIIEFSGLSSGQSFVAQVWIYG